MIKMQNSSASDLSIADWRQEFERLFGEFLPQASQDPTQLHQAMRYSALNGGKRIRPQLVYLTGKALDAKPSDLDICAAAVELIHCYSLVHDDLPAMDDDDLRRGQPTCHIQFDEATAILAGDALHTLAFEVLASDKFSQQASTQQNTMIRLLAKASGSIGMGGGQAIDLASTNKTIDLATLETMHRMKTGALIKASVLLGAYCAGPLSAEHKAALEQYAEAIGLAFQVKDDILDIESDTQTLGKPQGSDQAMQKNTYPALLGLDGAKHKLNDLLELSLQALDQLPYNSASLAEVAQFIVNRDS